MFILLISDNTSHFFDDANVLPTDILMVRRSTDNLTNITDEQGNKPDKVIIDACVHPQRYIDMLSELDEGTQVLLRFDQCGTWYDKDSFIELLELGLEYLSWE